MTLIIENVKEEFLPIFREISKISYAKMKTKKTETKPAAQTKNKECKKIKQRRIPELDEAIRQYENGEYETYENFDEYQKAMNYLASLGNHNSIF